MIDGRYKPYHLPQISAPYTIILQKLDDENINYNLKTINPEELDDLNVSQQIVFSDEVENAQISDDNPIWVDKENNILDGHHRYCNALDNQQPIKSVVIDMSHNDACRLLNKIQDIYDYENSRNQENIVDNQEEITSDFVSDLQTENDNIVYDTPNNNYQKIIAYRKDPIKDNSVVGNFFILSPIDGFEKYEIEFDNLLDTDSLGVVYKNSQQPVDILSKIWFPNVNFEKLSEKYNTTPNNLKNRAIFERARSLKYDGIKYGDKLIQGLK